MIFRLLVLTLIIPLHSSSHFECKGKEIKYKVSGTVFQTSSYQGGAYNPFEPTPFPLANFELLVIKINNQDGIPTVISKIKTDKEGDFSVFLPPGKYGFIEESERDSITAGQYLPKGYYSGDMMEWTSSSWGINNIGPIQVIDKAITGIRITNSIATVCGMCP